MEQSIPAQVWFANETNMPSHGVKTLTSCWNEWANIAQPVLDPVLFEKPKQIWQEKVIEFFKNNNENRLIIKADSKEEALAFLSQVLDKVENTEIASNIFVFTQKDVFSRLNQLNNAIIPVVYDREIEEELGASKYIAIYPRNHTMKKSDIILEPIPYDALEKALKQMGKNRDEIAYLQNASGGSLTVLRRKLTSNEAINIPPWARDTQNLTSLVPLALVGAWDTKNTNDQTVLSLLARDKDFAIIEDDISKFLAMDNSPLWSISNLQGVISKIDTLFALKIIKSDLKRFYQVAEIVLSEDDPAFDLPEEQRILANILGKKRNFSLQLRKGIAETLVLLSLHGKRLFDIEGAYKAENVIKKILCPLTLRKLQTNDRDFPAYAEAAPNTFLSLLEDDLQQSNPIILGLLQPANTQFMNKLSCPGLLFALEGLAWNSNTFDRVVKILAKLADAEINNDLESQSIHLLISIFCIWMPQTAANRKMRLSALERLMKDHPNLGWEIAIQQMSVDRNGIGTFNYKFLWRNDGYGFGGPITDRTEIVDFKEALSQILLDKKTYAVNEICDLIVHLAGFTTSGQERILDIVRAWYEGDPDDSCVLKVQQAIKENSLKINRLDSDLRQRAQAVFSTIIPKDIIYKHAWLFQSDTIQPISQQEYNEVGSFSVWDTNINDQRVNALKQIAEEKGPSGILNLAMLSNYPILVGELSSSFVLTIDEVEKFVTDFLQAYNPNETHELFITGLLYGIEESSLERLYHSLAKIVTNKDLLLHFFKLSPLKIKTWQLVDTADLHRPYWVTVQLNCMPSSTAENIEAVKNLVNIGRPRAAFFIARLILNDLSTDILYRILEEILGSDEDNRSNSLDEYRIRQAFEILTQAADLALEKKAVLEFLYINIWVFSFFRDNNHPIPNVERFIEENPDFYIQVIVAAFKRKDGGKDPPHYEYLAQNKNFSKRSRDLFYSIEHIPGSAEKDNDAKCQKLLNWIETVRSNCAQLGRLPFADEMIGQMLSNAKKDLDGIWPETFVRDVVEKLQSKEIALGIFLGKLNKRGAYMRSDGGKEEYEIAAKYDNWAEQLLPTHPFVSNQVLKAIAQSYKEQGEKNANDQLIENRLGYNI